MSTEQRIVDYICEQANLPGLLSYRKMFGEYALYMDGKVIALICDNLLYLKPTIEGKAVLGQTTDAPPMPAPKKPKTPKVAKVAKTKTASRTKKKP